MPPPESEFRGSKFAAAARWIRVWACWPACLPLGDGLGSRKKGFLWDSAYTKNSAGPSGRAFRKNASKGDFYIARPPMTAPPSKDGPRVNDAIKSQTVRLIDAEGEQVGVVHIREALEMAEQAGLDLVEISPNAEPPVCKILDFGKFKYESQKRKAEQKKKQKVIEIKEIKLRPNIDDNDYDVKMRALRRFIEEGNKVKVTIMFRGRELSHQDLGRNVLLKVAAELKDLVTIERDAKLEGKNMIMILAPKAQPKGGNSNAKN